MNEAPHNLKLDRGDPPTIAPFDLVRPKRRLTPSNIDYLHEYAAAGESGEISAFVVCAIGPSLSTWRGWSGGMGRRDRVNLIGQLQLLAAELIEAQQRAEQLGTD